MSNKKLWKIGLFFLIVSVLSFGLFNIYDKKEDTNPLNKNKLRSIAQLATLKTYYHNTTDFEKPGKVFILSNKRTEWIEYSGVVEIGTNIAELDMSVKDENVTIKLPHSKIISCKIDHESLNKENYYVKYDGFFPEKIDAEDQKEAFEKAETEMKKEAKRNQMLFIQADERAEELLINYVKNIGKSLGKKYKVEIQFIEDKE